DRSATMGYCLDDAAWDRGFATEAADALFQWAFDTLDLNRVQAETDTRNTASRPRAGKARLCAPRHATRRLHRERRGAANLAGAADRVRARRRRQGVPPRRPNHRRAPPASKRRRTSCWFCPRTSSHRRRADEGECQCDGERAARQRRLRLHDGHAVRLADLYPLADPRAVTSGHVKAKSSYLNLIASALREVS